jgi:hypothetical protein
MNGQSDKLADLPHDQFAILAKQAKATHGPDNPHTYYYNVSMPISPENF